MYPLKIQEKYDPKDLQNLAFRFTTAYLGNYIPGDYFEESGSHPGVDIVPNRPNEDVFCVLDGTVFKAGEDAAFGKYVFIEHKNVPNPDNLEITATLFSCYEHLSDLQVKTGDVLKEGDIIGKTGNTGISYGEHLHFQIDRVQAPNHAYWPYDGAEIRKLGVPFSEGVNLKLGIDKAKIYTVNPLVYLDKIGKGVDGKSIQDFKKPNDNRIIASIDSKPIEEQTQINDISKDDKFFQFINQLLHKNIVKLFDNNFKPNDLVTRGEFLKVILLKSKKELSTDDGNYFLDILNDSWQKKYVNTALSLGIINNKNQKFNPNDNISRVEALKMYSNLLKIDVGDNYQNNFKDVLSTDWFAKYVSLAFQKNIFQTTDNFYPNKDLTRYELVSLLYNLN